MIHERLQNELAVSFHVSLQCVSYKLKFFTGNGLLALLKLTLRSKTDTISCRACLDLYGAMQECV